jgi:hypothetical protein
MAVNHAGATAVSARIASPTTTFTTRKSGSTDPESFSVDLALATGVTCAAATGTPKAPDVLQLTITPPGKAPMVTSFPIF